MKVFQSHWKKRCSFDFWDFLVLKVRRQGSNRIFALSSKGARSDVRQKIKALNNGKTLNFLESLERCSFDFWEISFQTSLLISA